MPAAICAVLLQCCFLGANWRFQLLGLLNLAYKDICMLQLREHPENLNSNPLLMALGTIFLVWLVFGFSVWYAFYATLLAGIAGGLTLLTGKRP